MDRRYEAYCLADPYFYDHPALREDLAPAFPQVRRPAPAGWSAGPNGDWWHLLPDGHGLPEQGWKIHVSATPQDAERVLDLVWETCAGAGLPFKFLRSRGLLFLRNSKYAERGGSGKFATVYPRDDEELERAAALLGKALDGTAGPYILSDLRIGQGPVYVRYGSFVPRKVLDESGDPVPALAHPDGHLVPDRRTPVFSPPEWVTLPAFLDEHLRARGEVSLAGLPYTVHKALHFSNGGGVYQGTDTRTGREVVLKEGRPHAGLLADGRDAIARLATERAVLERAAGTGAGPEVIEELTVGEHRFLVLEFVPGKTLNNLFSERYPLTCADPEPEALRTYTQWALGIQAKVEAAVDALHGRGVVFNDLHLFNIMVRPDDTVTLIDFEVAAFTEQARTQTLASRAFQAPKGTAGPAVDRYALACLRLALFLPLTALLPLDRSRAAAMARTIRAEFPDVPQEFLDEAVAVITADLPQGPEIPAAAAKESDIPPFDPGAALEALDWPALRASLAQGILAAASPEREDRLYPGDVAQFAGPGGGLGLAHGAAGVLYALHTTGAPVPKSTSRGSRNAPRTCRRTPASGSTPARSASPSPWICSGARTPRTCWSKKRSRSAGSGSGPGSATGWPASAWAWRTSPPAPRTPPCSPPRSRPGAWPRNCSRRAPTAPGARTRRRGAPGCCTGRAGRRCCSCACSSRPGTPTGSPGPGPRCAWTPPAACGRATGRCAWTTAGGPCPTSPGAAPGSAWRPAASCTTARRRTSPPPSRTSTAPRTPASTRRPDSSTGAPDSCWRSPPPRPDRFPRTGTGPRRSPGSRRHPPRASRPPRPPATRSGGPGPPPRTPEHPPPGPGPGPGGGASPRTRP